MELWSDFDHLWRTQMCPLSQIKSSLDLFREIVEWILYPFRSQKTLPWLVRNCTHAMVLLPTVVGAITDSSHRAEVRFVFTLPPFPKRFPFSP